MTTDANAACGWRREMVRISEVVSLEATPINPERSARFLVDVEQCPGDLPAQPTYGFTLENEYVSLTMSVWRHLPNCTAPETVQRPVTIRFLYASTWKFVLADSSQRTVVVTAAPGTCNTAQTTCDEDCDCTEGVCLSAPGLGGPIARCARPCEVDRDCGGDGTCESAADELSFVCQPGAPECGGSAAPCPTGFGCQGGVCTPTFVLNASTRHECTCDSECNAGLHCTFHDGAATGRCEALCLTESDGWCEGAHTCGRGSIEGVPGVCGWVGE